MPGMSGAGTIVARQLEALRHDVDHRQEFLKLLFVTTSIFWTRRAQS
jgi:hypothetical protein